VLGSPGLIFAVFVPGSLSNRPWLLVCGMAMVAVAVGADELPKHWAGRRRRQPAPSPAGTGALSPR
jgi:hypothetical protein